MILINKHTKSTSDGGNWNHSVALPIILIKIKVGRMFQFSFIRYFITLVNVYVDLLVFTRIAGTS